jgi:type II restriction enzyme
MRPKSPLEKYNKLQSATRQKFVSHFASNTKLVYFNDATKKTLIFEKEIFTRIGIPILDPVDLPDIVLFDEGSNWLFLIAVVTASFPKPISPNRRLALDELFRNSTAGRVYVNAFLDFATFKKFVGDISWETEVWIAETPSHMIHFNGDKFLGPHA